MTVQSFVEFRPRIDRWATWLVMGSCAILPGACFFALTDSVSGPIVQGFIILSTILILSFLIWVYYGTRYRLTQSHLLVRNGPFKTDIKLNDIISIEPTRSIQSGPALSRDRFLIRYNRYATVMISPEDRGRFLQEVVNRAPHLIWQGNKLVSFS